jgi:ABC-type microcin C transport system permease subunit YejB
VRELSPTTPFLRRFFSRSNVIPKVKFSAPGVYFVCFKASEDRDTPFMQQPSHIFVIVKGMLTAAVTSGRAAHSSWITSTC